MKKINKDLAQRLAYEERLCIYRLAHKGKINQNDIEYSMYTIQHLTELNIEAKDFTPEVIATLGIDNCCKIFKALCKQYRIFKNPENEFADKEAHEFRCEIEAPISYGKTQKMDIGLYDAASTVNQAIDDNFNELRNGSMQGNSDENIYRYAQINTFADVYYRIRDVIEGKSYYDNHFMTEYRELSEEYAQKSEEIISSYAKRKGISTEETKKQLMQDLNDGVSELSQTPIKVETAKTSFGFNR